MHDAHSMQPLQQPDNAGPYGLVVASRPSRSTAGRLLVWGALAVLLVSSVALGALLMTSDSDGGGTRLADPTRNASWSYYHDREYRTADAGAKWHTDRSRSTDPDEAVLGNTSRWEYDGPYRYGPYGSDGMQRRRQGRESRDPLYSQPTPLPDVFSAHGGSLDPSGGEPVGMAPSSMTNPYFDPYAGYSNPYANRIRMAWGEGVGRGAAYDPLP